MEEGFTFDVQEYCSYCGDFTPELMQVDITAYGDKQKRALNTVSCKNSGKCAHLRESLKKHGVIE